MPSYGFNCKKCKTAFEDLCSFSDLEAGFPDVRCPSCNSKSLNKNIPGVPGAIFGNPRESKKWDNFSYRAGKTMEEAKQCRRDAEVREGQKTPREYRKNFNDTNNGNRMNFID